MWSFSDSLLYCPCDQRVAEVSLHVSAPLEGRNPRSLYQETLAILQPILRCLFKTHSRAAGIVWGLLPFPPSICYMAGSPWAGGAARRSDTNLSIQARKEQGNGFSPVIMGVLATARLQTRILYLITTTQALPLICSKTVETQIWDECMDRKCVASKIIFEKFRHILEIKCYDCYWFGFGTANQYLKFL